MSTEIVCVVGARPNFMKIAPIMAAFAKHKIEAKLVHTGQHYDPAMSDSFFEQLGIPRPDVNLEVGSASHAVQTAEIMRAFESVLDAESPKAILVVGDVNSTIACALVAAKKGVKVIHVEAGLRSYDRAMPEEINRVLTDQISDLLFTTERAAEANLAREGIAADRVQFAGNVMIDTLRAHLARAVPALQTLAGIPARGYAVVTLHRPSNVDHEATFRALLEALNQVAEKLDVVFPIHPRTKATAERFGMGDLLNRPGMRLLPPQGYLEMLGLTRDATVVLTDSGGLQEETTALGVPCITLRENTERPITIAEGTNTLTGPNPEKILQCLADILENGGKRGRIPEYWDGQAADRIAIALRAWLNVL
jgi:UDP-N-acetylglucosamine 2-epimerase (non-hydrolysing)